MSQKKPIIISLPELPVDLLSLLPLDTKVYIVCELEYLPVLKYFLDQKEKSYSGYITVDGEPIEDWWSSDSKTIQFDCTVEQFLKILNNDFSLLDAD